MTEKVIDSAIVDQYVALAKAFGLAVFEPESVTVPLVDVQQPEPQVELGA